VKKESTPPPPDRTTPSDGTGQTTPAQVSEPHCAGTEPVTSDGAKPTCWTPALTTPSTETMSSPSSPIHQRALPSSE
jgi:hypothetical protein